MGGSRQACRERSRVYRVRQAPLPTDTGRSARSHGSALFGALGNFCKNQRDKLPSDSAEMRIRQATANDGTRAARDPPPRLSQGKGASVPPTTSVDVSKLGAQRRRSAALHGTGVRSLARAKFGLCEHASVLYSGRKQLTTRPEYCIRST